VAASPACLLWLALFAAAAVSAQEAPPPDPSAPPAAFTGEIEVVGASPLHGAGSDLDHAPGNVQTATAEDVAATRPRDLSDLLAARMGSVSVIDTEGNPFERDLQFRGFAASPVLGSAQGIAVYQDGVRLNEPFGDTVDWDLVPLPAVAEIELVPGSNPVFGLNAQGGALEIATKTGFTHPGVEARLEGGSFGQRRLELAAGRRASSSPGTSTARRAGASAPPPPSASSSSTPAGPVRGRASI
jgi:iron complex outermembrane receptor protein